MKVILVLILIVNSVKCNSIECLAEIDLEVSECLTDKMRKDIPYNETLPSPFTCCYAYIIYYCGLDAKHVSKLI